MKVYAIKDKLIGFTGPIAMKNQDVAKRWFESFCLNKKSTEKIKTKDFELWEIGEYNEDNGTITGYALSELKLIMEGEIFDEPKN